ncbi:MAG: AAA family ATPase [Phycisphaerae bacterium]|nr:AAA family ATPase [Phycisphaerae bacterium]
MKNEKEVGLFREKVKVFIERFGMTQAQFAKKIGVSTTTLNLFLKGTYTGKNESICKAVQDYLNREGRRQRRKKTPDFVETIVAKRILENIRLAEQFTQPGMGRICVIVGDSGHGKTECLKQYARVHPHSTYIEINDNTGKPQLFAKINRALGLNYTGTVKRMIEELSEYLAGREMTIILDEAAALNATKLSLLRQIVSGNGCTLVLAGNNHLLATINDPVTRRGYECLDQFRSRMMGILNLDELAMQSPRNGGLYSIPEVRKLYATGGIKLSSDAEGLLLSIQRTPHSGRNHTCSLVISAILTSRQGKNVEVIDAARIIGAIRQFGMLEGRLPLIIDMAEQIEKQQTAAKTA